MVSEAEKKAPGPSEAEVSETIDGVAAGAQKQDGDVGLTESAGPAGDAVVDKEQAAIQDDAVESDCEPGLIQDQLQEQVEQLQSELADAKDQAMRAIAESQNARRRAEKDVTNARRFALEKFVQELLPVIDNLERAMESAQADAGPDESMLQGLELTLKSFFDVLKRANVEPVDPLSEPFDPQLHEAISMVKNSEVEPNTVLNVVQKGYTLNGRLVRAAMVVVSSA